MSSEDTHTLTTRLAAVEAERLPDEIVKAIDDFEGEAQRLGYGECRFSQYEASRAALDAAILRHIVSADQVPMPQNADQAVGLWLIAENWVRTNAPERLKPEIQDTEVKLSDALARAERAEKALEAIQAREAAEARQIATEQRAQNIAYLQANIAQMERFMERGQEADPIGYSQWRRRRDEFKRELDAALSSVAEGA